ncbi:VWA domain-containing protein [Salinactinospora qingdaonensis]|uniref:Substrate-binding domain-containing protein n=1 Tax=Salinactinospora qingdaonensis TaxID=702744 RepID=A0ABP7GF31_9ACTN
MPAQLKTHRGRSRKRHIAIAAATALAVTLAGTSCEDDQNGPESAPTGPGKAGELRILAGSEIADLEPLLERAEEEIGVTVHLDYTGTLDGVQQVVEGQTEERYDAVWFASNRYLNLYPDGEAAVRTEEPIMASPVVMGVSESLAIDLGWDEGAEVSWSEIASAAAEGQLSYGMTSPAASNSGFSALIGVASALTDSGTALRAADVERVTPELRAFFTGQQLTAGSSGWLSEEYVRRAGTDGPGAELDGMINYESVLLSVNESGKLPEPLTVIYPSDGAVTADYPLSLLAGTTDEVTAGYRDLVDYLSSPEVQREIMADTHRRPLSTEVSAEADFPAVTELPFPAGSNVVNELISSYFDEIRKPARTVYVLDASYSMEGERIAGLRKAMTTLTGGDADSISGQFQRFYAREEVTLLAFDGAPRAPETFTVPKETPDPVLTDIKETVDGIGLGPATAGYDALVAAYDVLAEESASNTEQFTSIVLLTDGEVNTGRSLADFRAEHADFDERLRDVPVFTVLFGDGNTAEMEELAEVTGGQTFDARESSLDAAFREIRGYQ